ncbi:MAG: ABC transporter substrate-binding protein, partial [Rhodobacterales bacterium]
AYTKRLPQALVALEQLAYAEREFATFQRAKVTQYLVDAIESVVTGNAEASTALAEAQKGADKVLADYQ